MKFILVGILFSVIVLADNIQIIFPTQTMSGDDLIYRSRYLFQCIANLSVIFQAGPQGGTYIVTSLSFPKYTLMDELDIYGEPLYNNTLPKSIAVYPTVTQKNDINDTSEWTRDETNQLIIINFPKPKQYYIDYGVHTYRNNPNGVPCNAYTLTYTFLLVTSDSLVPYGKLSGLVSLLVPNETTASTSLQSTLLSKSQGEASLTSSVASSLIACDPDSPDCEEEATQFNLADTAKFLFRLTDSSQKNTYYMRNLKVSMSIGTDTPIDFTGLATITSSSTTKGEIRFDMIMAIAGQPITITTTSTLSISATRMLQSEDSKGIATITQVKVNNPMNLDDSSYSTPTVGASTLVTLLVMFFLLNIAFI